jgi:hypothetical protein
LISSEWMAPWRAWSKVLTKEYLSVGWSERQCQPTPRVVSKELQSADQSEMM